MVTIGVALIYGLSGFIALMVIGFYVFDRFARRRLGVESYSARSIANRVTKLIGNARSQDWNEAEKSIELLFTELVSLWSITNFYKWAFGVILSIVTALAGTLGTIVLIKQNEKLSEQIEVARGQAALQVQEFIRGKTVEIGELSKKIQEFRLASVSSGSVAALVSALNPEKPVERPCWPSSSIEKISKENLPTLRATNALLSVSVRSALEGARGDASHLKAFRSKIVQILATSGLPFDLFESDQLFVDLSGANLSGANFDHSIFQNPTFNSSNLSEVCAVNWHAYNIAANYANFDSSELLNPVFRLGQFKWTSFRAAKIRGSKPLAFRLRNYPEPVNPPNMTMKENLARSIFERVRDYILNVFAKLWPAPDYGGSFYNDDTYYYNYDNTAADLSRSDLTGADFTSATLDTVLFAGSNLKLSNFRDAALVGINSFAQADLRNSDFRVSSLSELEKVDFRKAIFGNTAVDDLDFGANPTLTVAQLSSACTCSGAPPSLRGKALPMEKCVTVAVDTSFKGEKGFSCSGKFP